MMTSPYKAFAPKAAPVRYAGVGHAYRAMSHEHRAALAVWEGEGGRIAPVPPSRP